MAELLHSRVIRFGVFEADLRTQELRKHGLRVKLPRQSFQVLEMLLDRPGELVTREELQNSLWPVDTFVDFENGLNNAVKRIRGALGDSADSPRFVETLPRLGYRFIGAVEPRTNGFEKNAGHGRGPFTLDQDNGVGSVVPSGGPYMSTEPPTVRSEGRSARPGSEDSANAFVDRRIRATSEPRMWHIAVLVLAFLALAGLGITLWRAGRNTVPPTLT